MKDESTVGAADQSKPRKEDAPKNAPGTQEITGPVAKPGQDEPPPRRSPDAEGGQPVDELDLDGDGARRP